MEKQEKILKYIVKKTKSDQSISKSNINFIKSKLAKVQNQTENQTESQSENRPEKNELEEQLEIERNKNKKLNNDLKAAVALLKDAGAVNLQKDIQLRKHIGKKPAQNDTELFKELLGRGDLDLNQINKLRSIPAGKSRDSTFILTLMRFLYPNPDDLSNKSVTGRQRNNVKKPKLTPQKEKLIKSMLKERICAEKGCIDSDILQRLGRANKLMTDAITKIKPKSAEKTTSGNNQIAVNLSVDQMQSLSDPNQMQSPTPSSQIHSMLPSAQTFPHQTSEGRWEWRNSHMHAHYHQANLHQPSWYNYGNMMHPPMYSQHMQPWNGYQASYTPPQSSENGQYYQY